MSSYGCGIPDYDSIVLTGGYDPDDNIQLSSVQRYDLNGFVENLPSLNEAREIHGCGCYYNNDGEKVKFKLCVSLYRAASSGLPRCWRIQFQFLLLLRL